MKEVALEELVEAILELVSIQETRERESGLYKQELEPPSEASVIDLQTWLGSRRPE